MKALALITLVSVVCPEQIYIIRFSIEDSPTPIEAETFWNCTCENRVCVEKAHEWAPTATHRTIILEHHSQQPSQTKRAWSSLVHSPSKHNLILTTQQKSKREAKQAKLGTTLIRRNRGDRDLNYKFICLLLKNQALQQGSVLVDHTRLCINRYGINCHPETPFKHWPSQRPKLFDALDQCTWLAIEIHHHQRNFRLI